MFHFGAALHLSPSLSLYSFLGVIAFLIFFDYVSGVIEYFLERSPLYNRMLQMMYKELMLMGLVAFAISIYGASNSAQAHSEYIINIDFAHVILFYMTLFFVVHAFFLMGMSIFNEKKYQRMFSEDLTVIVAQVEKLSLNAIWKFFFDLEFWPFSKIRQNIEFHLLHSLFYNTYTLCESFDFANYLSASFGRYALKTINRSLFSWFCLILILVINFIRLEIGLGCFAYKDKSASSHHEDTTATHEDHHDDPTEVVTEDPHSSDPHFMFVHAMSADGGGDAAAVNALKLDPSCTAYSVRLFVFAGIVFASYMAVMVFISHFYKRRLLKFGGVREPREYLEFLKQRKLQQEEHKNNKHYDHHERFHNHELREEIEYEIHSSEHAGEEEEPEIKFLATTILKISKYVSETYVSIRLKFRLYFTQMFFPDRCKCDLHSLLVYLFFLIPTVFRSGGEKRSQNDCLKFYSSSAVHGSSNVSNVLCRAFASYEQSHESYFPFLSKFSLPSRQSCSLAHGSYG
jgi:hypothetical protein